MHRHGGWLPKVRGGCGTGGATPHVSGRGVAGGARAVRERAARQGKAACRGFPHPAAIKLRLRAAAPPRLQCRPSPSAFNFVPQTPPHHASTTAMGHAYGVAVMTVMFITTFLSALVMLVGGGPGSERGRTATEPPPPRIPP